MSYVLYTMFLVMVFQGLLQLLRQHQLRPQRQLHLNQLQHQRRLQQLQYNQKLQLL